MNETPRTDDEEKSTDKLDDQDWGQAGWRHARQLERELNEAIKQRDVLAGALHELHKQINEHGGGASLMHPRLTRAITAAGKLIDEQSTEGLEF